jgi:branched-chain amino acid transport system permease protein
MFRHTPLRYATLILLFSGAVFQAFTGDYYGLEILSEILILAILVLALDLVAGFGGMISLCHGALMGAGAYGFALLATQAGLSPAVAIIVALILVGFIGCIIGAICARSQGIYFIMATLAFGQMGYSYVFDAPGFGGDDGLTGIPRPDMSALNIDLGDSQTFALYCLAALCAAYGLVVLFLNSGVGRSLVGVMHNEVRMRALGSEVWKIKAIAFGISGMIAGVAGILLAQHSMYVSPSIMNWTVSGEALVVVILGGLGTLVGPIVGAVVFVVLKHQVSALTSYWHLVVGCLLIAVVMSGSNGIFGWVETQWTRHWKQRQSPRLAPRSEPTSHQETVKDA